MVISVCVNDAVLLLYCYYLKAALVHHVTLITSCFWWLSSVLQRYKTDVNTSIGWYINIISVNEITVFNCKFKLKPENLKCCYRIFYGRIPATTAARFFFFLSIFFFFFHTTQHNIQNTTKQNNRHILNISRFNQKGGREGRTTRTQKSLLHIITYIKKKTLPSINGRRPGPTDSRRCTFTWHYLQEATDPICFSTHVCCKPVVDYGLLRSCKTSKQHSLLHWTNTETRIIIKKT